MLTCSRVDELSETRRLLTINAQVNPDTHLKLLVCPLHDFDALPAAGRQIWRRASNVMKVATRMGSNVAKSIRSPLRTPKPHAWQRPTAPPRHHLLLVLLLPLLLLAAALSAAALSTRPPATVPPPPPLRLPRWATTRQARVAAGASLAVAALAAPPFAPPLRLLLAGASEALHPAPMSILSILLPRPAKLPIPHARKVAKMALRRGLPAFGATTLTALSWRFKWLRALGFGTRPHSVGADPVVSLRKLLLQGRQMASHTNAGAF